MNKNGNALVAFFLSLCVILCMSSCGDSDSPNSNSVTSEHLEDDNTSGVIFVEEETETENNVGGTSAITSSSVTVPKYSGRAYATINSNTPTFTNGEYTTTSFEKYSALDHLGRCGVAYACIGKEIMPTGERGEIGQVKPTGWHTVKYDGIDGKYLYNRCHLIGWQLTGENANTRNLITGTRFFNVNGMLPFENMVDDYIEETGNHVLYRVTPDFRGEELVARGVQIEAYSVEDDGDGICFNVYCYNIQPGIIIDYVTGSSSLDTSVVTTSILTTQTPTTIAEAITTSSNVTYIGNRNSKKFHEPDCGSVDNMNDSNKVYFYCSRNEIIADGYEPCGNCDP